MKITVLGTAAATSFPLAFCKCRVCEAARRNGGKDFRKRSSVVINGDLLIDLGPDSVTACFQYGVDISGIRYLLQTHAHADHFDAGIFATRHRDYAAADSVHLDVFCSEGTFRNMDKWVRSQEPSYDLYDEQIRRAMHFDYHPVSKNKTITFGDYTVHAIDSLHDPGEEALVYVVSHKSTHILYGTDLLQFDDEAWEILGKYRLSAVFLDQTYGKGCNAGGHTDAGMAAQYVSRMRKMGVIDGNTQVFATHLSHEGNDIHHVMEEAAQKHGYHIAYDGMTVEVG
ncbi:MAG: MBL fold metallo-hydrolase [Clostridia bacterium]|nr:MBL fold metallo-hydrolase [Clostridia bacterium]